MSPEKSARLMLWINAIVYLDFGLAAIAFPEWITRQLGIELTSATAFADFRAIYGGLPLGVGLAMLAGVYRQGWLLSAVALVALCSLELFLGRMYSVVVSGSPELAIYVFMGLELAAFVWAAQCYRALATGRAPAGARAAQPI